MLIVFISQLVDYNIELTYDFSLYKRLVMYIVMFSGP
jgi:hypothetical protein